MNTMRPRWGAGLALGLLFAAGCSGGAPTNQPAGSLMPAATQQPPTDQPSGAPAPASGATTHDEFNTLLCDSFRALFRAVGNPDTGSHSDLMKTFDAAVANRDAAAAAAIAETIMADLRRGQDSATRAAGWAPRADLAGHVRTVLAAFEAGVRAEAALATRGPAEATPAFQLAFESAGGVEAWRAMRGAASRRTPAPGESPMRCGDDVPVTLP